MQFNETQEAIIQARESNVIVSASAGSGKTSVLVERLARLVLEERMGVDKILAMTFTNDAASEMKSRLKRKMVQVLEETKDDWIASQIALLETASICTIDSFCADLLRKYYYHLQIPYAMASTLISASQQNEAIASAHNMAIASLDPADYANLRIYLQAYSKSEEDLQKCVLRFVEMANAKPDPIQWMSTILHSASRQKDLHSWFCAWFAVRVEAMTEILQNVEERLYEEDYAKESKKMQDIKDVQERLASLQPAQKAIENQDYPAFRQAFLASLQGSKSLGKTYNKHSYAALQEDFRALEKDICDVLFPLDVFEQDAKRLSRLEAAFIQLAMAFYEAYAAAKRSLQVIDYADMEHFAWKLLQLDVVQEEIRSQYAAIMIDEFQDTNQLQEAIITSFARRDNTFRVGDIKQSIYGFRQARPEIMEAYMEKQDPLWKTMVMQHNYRSSQSLITFNNALYSRIMNTKLLGSQFSSADAAITGTQAQKACEQKPVRFLFTQYEPWAIAQSVGGMEARKQHTAYKADLIAQDILKQHKAGLPYRSICILTRSHLSHEDLKTALEAYGIPVLAEIDHGFYTNQAIQIVLAALKVRLQPQDDIAMTAFLCSSLGQVSHAALASAASFRQPGTSIYGALKDSPLLDAWRDLMKMPAVSVPALLKAIYNYKDFYYRATTAQDKTNLDLLMELAATTYKDADLPRFLNLVEKEARLDKTSEAYPFGKEEDVVKIKTMHHAKGLQFPLVYIYSRTAVRDMEAGAAIRLDSDAGLALSGIDASFQLKRPSMASLALEYHHMAEEMKEEMRLFYVATTRAESELVIVDAIKSLEAFDYPLHTRALLKNRSYTSWLLHANSQEKLPNFVLDEVTQLTQRPDARKHPYTWQPLPLYTKPTVTISSRTASAAKKKLSWQPVKLTPSNATTRGTRFHEAAGAVSYPYTKEALKAFAAAHAWNIREEDIQQILSLNDNAQYAAWMQARHRFECSYINSINGTISHGFMDLVAWMGDEIHILDFKSDYVSHMDQLKARYSPQLQVYKEAMNSMEPEKKVRTFIYSFHLKEMCEIM